MLIPFSEKKDAIPALLRHHTVNLRQGVVMSMVGSQMVKTGTGKSHTACKFGEMYDEDFSIDNVVYYPKDFLAVMDRIENEGKMQRLVVVDEGEVTAPASLWYSFTNKAISYNLATFRYLQSVAVFVAPGLSWLDKKVRFLNNYIGFTDKYWVNWNSPQKKEQKAVVKLRLYRVKTDFFAEKMFLNKIRMYDQQKKQICCFKRFHVEPISEDLAKAYEAKSREFKKVLRQGLIKEAARFTAYQEGKDNAGKVDLRAIIPRVIGNETLRGDFAAKGRISKAALQNELELEGIDLSNWQVDRLKLMVNKAYSGKS